MKFSTDSFQLCLKYLLIVILATCNASFLQHAHSEPAAETSSLPLQIFLDEANFGPGKLDGEMGEFTRKALARYKKSKNLPIDESTEALNLLPIDQALIDYTIQLSDLEGLTPIPETPGEMAKLQHLYYQHPLELLGEKFHSDVDFLKTINASIPVENWKEGVVIKVPKITPFEIRSVTKGDLSLKKDAIPDTRHALISLSEKLLDVLDDETLIAAFPITPGSNATPAPQGEWKINSVVGLPDFRWDPSVLSAGVKSDESFLLHPGPNNPVGVVWMGLNKEFVGIHGTNEPDAIGRSSSHGCIRLANWDAIKLSKLIRIGTHVTIQK